MMLAIALGGEWVVSLSLIVAAAALAASENAPRGPAAAASATADVYPRPARAIVSEPWITSEDSPPEALWAWHEGTTRVRYIIGRDGRIRDCTIVQSSGHAELDERSCALLTERGRFHPGLGSDAQPTEDWRIQNITWRIPGTGYPPPTFVLGYVALTVPAVGSPEGPYCVRAARPALLAPLAVDMCAELLDYLPSAPRSGEPHPALALISLAHAEDPLPRPQRMAGRLVYREQAAFEIGEDGAVVGCRATVTRRRTRDDHFDLCRFLETEDGPYFTPGETPAPGHAQMSIELYRLEAPLHPLELQSLAGQPAP